MKRSFLEGLFKDLEVDDSVKKTIIDNIMDENGNDVNAEKAKTETAKNEVKVKEGVIESLNTKIKELGDIDVEQIKNEIDELITHSIFYTSITRAKEKLKIYWSPECQNKIISTIKHVEDNKDVNLIKNKINPI